MAMFLLAFAQLMMLWGCRKSANLPGASLTTTRISVGYGPEDLIVDSFSNPSPRILVSCDSRRENEPQQAGIWTINPRTGQSAELPRLGEPENIPFHPHGIDLIRQDGIAVLSVVSHDDSLDRHYLFQYRVEADRLIFLRSLNDPLIHSPNAVAALPNGDLLITNDSGKRGNRLEALFKRKKSTVVRYRHATGEWRVVADQLAYANGITFRDDLVYVATTRQNRVFRYRLTDSLLVDRGDIAVVSGGDNLRWNGPLLICPGHPKILAFLRHAGSMRRHSPSEIWRIDPGTGRKELFYASQGDPISGASTAVILDRKMYIGQVFDPFVLVVNL